MKNNVPQNVENYGKNYSDRKLWSKVKRVAKKAGAKVVYMALLLFYVLKSPQVSTEEKAKICGALGYFILPVDLIADVLPAIGYTDDIGVLAWALHAVWKNITPEIKQQARQKLNSFFGNIDEEELENI